MQKVYLRACKEHLTWHLTCCHSACRHSTFCHLPYCYLTCCSKNYFVDEVSFDVTSKWHFVKGRRNCNWNVVNFKGLLRVGWFAKKRWLNYKSLHGCDRAFFIFLWTSRWTQTRKYKVLIALGSLLPPHTYLVLRNATFYLPYLTFVALMFSKLNCLFSLSYKGKEMCVRYNLASDLDVLGKCP